MMLRTPHTVSAVFFSLSRYSGGGLGRGFIARARGISENPHPNPPPEYRERE